MLRTLFVVSFLLVAFAQSANATVTVTGVAAASLDKERATFVKEAVEQALRMRKIKVGANGEETVVVSSKKLGSYVMIRLERLRQEALLAEAESRAKLKDDDAILDIATELVDEIYPRTSRAPAASQAELAGRVFDSRYETPPASAPTQQRAYVVSQGAPVQPQAPVYTPMPLGNAEQLRARAAALKVGGQLLIGVGVPSLVLGVAMSVAGGLMNHGPILGGGIALSVASTGMVIGGSVMMGSARKLQKQASGHIELSGVGVAPSQNGAYVSAAFRY